jgi:hypothetical protein
MVYHQKLDDLQEESKKVGLQINPLKTEEIRVNTIINRVLFTPTYALSHTTMY